MRRILYLVFSLILFAAISGCNTKDVTNDVDLGYKYPVAAFSYTGNDGPAPVEIQFTNYSETIITDSCSYLWKFGEHGPTSTSKDPIHTFNNNSAGTTTVLVSMTVHDLVSDLSQTRSVAIDIKPAL